MDDTPQTSPAKVEANRQNSQSSTGPRNTTSTRFNAQKHGLLSKGVTELDDHDHYHELLDGLRDEFRPVGIVESFLVERIALTVLRVQRAARLEAEHVTSALNPAVTKPLEGDLNKFLKDAFGGVEVISPGLPCSLSAASIEVVDAFARYETMHENRLYRAVILLRQMQHDR